MRLSSLAEKVTTELARRAVDDAEARTAYKIADAHARLTAKVEGGPRRTVAEIEAIAMIATQDEYRSHSIAEARFKAAVSAGHNYRAQLSALQSVNANLRNAILTSSGVGS